MVLFMSQSTQTTAAPREFLHQRPDQHKSFPGWQEPGLWRPKWVMEREFFATKSAKPYRDRIYFKMKNDRTIRFCNSSKRPLFEWFKKSSSAGSADGADKKKRLFESGAEVKSGKAEDLKAFREEQMDLYTNADGTWSFTDESPSSRTGKVEIETREGEHKDERIRHVIRCDWGKNDGYAAMFRRGRIYKFKGVKKGTEIPLGTYVAGSCIIRANVQRPLVSKDFLAFQ